MLFTIEVDVVSILIVQFIAASELEFGQGIRRAESCDSVASDSSVLEMQPDMPKIGQLEFALEYDRYVYGLDNFT